MGAYREEGYYSDHTGTVLDIILNCLSAKDAELDQGTSFKDAVLRIIYENIDATLTKVNYAADAAAVGRQFNIVDERITTLEDETTSKIKKIDGGNASTVWG